MTFAPRPPAPISYGFTAGVMRLTWMRGEDSFPITGREGRVFVAVISEFAVDHQVLPSAMVTAALVGLVVRAPDGSLSRITAVEAFCTMQQTINAKLGLLLVPVEEP